MSRAARIGYTIGAATGAYITATAVATSLLWAALARKEQADERAEQQRIRAAHRRGDMAWMTDEQFDRYWNAIPRGE